MNKRLADMVAEHALVLPEGSHVDGVRFLALALAGEAGEAANVVKKDWRDNPNSHLEKTARNGTWFKLVDELTDIANYAFMLARHMDVDLEAEMERKFAIVEGRPEYQAALKRRALVRNNNDAWCERDGALKPQHAFDTVGYQP